MRANAPREKKMRALFYMNVICTEVPSSEICFIKANLPIYVPFLLIPVQPWTDLQDSRRMSLPDFKTICKVVSPRHGPTLPPRRYPWY